MIKDIVGIGRDLIDMRKERKQKKHEIALRRMEAQANATDKLVDQQSGWEHLALQDVQQSWKDEYWTVILSIPLILVFVPSLQPIIAGGFSELENVPKWYTGGVALAWSLAFAKRRGVTLGGFFSQK